jgi:hypothetical protein
MGINFKEVAYLRGNDEVYKERFNQIDWSAHKDEEKSEPVSLTAEDKVPTEAHGIPYVEASVQEIINNASIKKDPSVMKCANTVILKDGDIEVSHRATGEGVFEFMLVSKKENTSIIIDEDTIFSKTRLPLLAESFVGLYFEALRNQNKEHGLE